MIAASKMIGAVGGRRLGGVDGSRIDAPMWPHENDATVGAAETAELHAVAAENVMTGHPFRELDDLVLHLKGLVLVSDLRRQRGAEADELDMYRGEIERARQRLGRFALEGSLPDLS